MLAGQDLEVGSFARLRIDVALDTVEYLRVDTGITREQEELRITGHNLAEKAFDLKSYYGMRCRIDK